MIMREITTYALVLLQLASASVAEEAECSVVPHVDRHMARSALDASFTSPVLGWRLSPACGAEQTHFRVTILHHNGNAFWSGSTVRSNRSQALPISLWSADGTAPRLAPATHYSVAVAVTLQGADHELWSTESTPTPFVTALSAAQLHSGSPMWSGNTAAQFILLRRMLPPTRGARTYLSITANPTPDWNRPEEHNSSHLLGAYKLWVNGVPLGAGPGRMVGEKMAVDSYNLTGLLHGESDVVAVEAYYRANYQQSPQQGSPLHADHRASDSDDRGGVLVWLHYGNGELEEGEADQWRVFDATAAFSPTILPGRGAGTNVYIQPHENIQGLQPALCRQPMVRARVEVVVSVRFRV